MFTKKKGLTGWMLRPWGLMEIPVGEMPMRGAPMLTPVADRLMPTGEVLMKQGLYENTEPPPEICTQADRPVTSCHVMSSQQRVDGLAVQYTCPVLISWQCSQAACRVNKNQKHSTRSCCTGRGGQ